MREAKGNVGTSSCHLIHGFTEDQRGDVICQCHKTDYLLIWDHDALFSTIGILNPILFACFTIVEDKGK